MTKYVLNSGAVKKYPDLTRKFFAEVFRGLGNTPKLLICCFAQPREDWEKKFAEDVQIFPTFFPEGLEVSIELAHPESFIKQCRTADAIFIHGGDDYLIQYWLHKFDIPKIWQGKVVATSSAGSDVLAKYFWTGDWRQNMEGLGILPIKFLAHYKSSYGADDPRGPIDWEVAQKTLAEYGDQSLVIHALKEGEFVVISS